MFAMTFPVRLAFTASLLGASAFAQNDALSFCSGVGLTIEGTTPGTFFGATCALPSCAPHQAGNIAPGSTRTVTIHGAPFLAYALAISTPPTICVYYPWLNSGLVTANALTLRQPYVIAFGVLGPPSPNSQCGTGLDTFTLAIPAQLPPGLQFVMQGLAPCPQFPILTFTPTIQATIQ
jgi:hypothetical protein